MNAAEAKRIALDVLNYMRKNEKDCARVYGYVWGSLSRIAGTPDLPLPHEEREADALIGAQQVRS